MKSARAGLCLVHALALLASFAGAQEPKPPAKVPCRSLPDPQARVQPILDRLVAGLRDQRQVEMSVQLVYAAALAGPAYGGGDTPALSATPRGTVWIGPEFIDFCYDEQAMAMILGHELAHVYLGHAKLRMDEWLTWRGERVASNNDNARRRSARWQAAHGEEVRRHEQVSGPTPGEASGYGRFQVENARFLQRQEAQADEMGAVIASQAGYDPRRGLSWFYSFGHVWPGLNIRDPLSTHPSLPDRIADIQYWADRHFPTLAASLPGAAPAPVPRP